MKLTDLEKLKQKGLIRGFEETGKAEKPNKTKYGAKKVQIGEISFDSKKEAKRYLELRKLAILKQISSLSLQVEFELNDGGTHSLKYIADFLYFRDGRLVVEDVKGYKTATYRKKRKLMKQLYGIEILET
jgi:hypothetical protein